MFEFLFEYPPSPRTIQRVIDTVQITRDRIKKEHGIAQSYWAGQVAVLDQLIEDLTAYKKQIDYAKPIDRSSWYI